MSSSGSLGCCREPPCRCCRAHCHSRTLAPEPIPARSDVSVGAERDHSSSFAHAARNRSRTRMMPSAPPEKNIECELVHKQRISRSLSSLKSCVVPARASSDSATLVVCRHCAVSQLHTLIVPPESALIRRSPSTARHSTSAECPVSERHRKSVSASHSYSVAGSRLASSPASRWRSMVPASTLIKPSCPPV